MQPGVVPGAVLELHAAKAFVGLIPGINDPRTMQFYDTSDNGNHGTLTGFGGGAAWVGDGSGGDPYRLTLDRVSTPDYVSLPDLGAAEDRVFTYEAWLLTTDATAVDRVLVGEGSTASPNHFVYLELSPTHKAAAWMRAGGGALSITGGAVLNDGAPHHVVFTCDASYMRLYVDGVAVGAPVAPSAAPALNTTAVGILDRVSDFGPFAGDVLPVRIYPFTLTPEQVAQNYAVGTVWAPAASAPPEEPTAFLWTNSYLSEIAADLTTIRAAGIDILFSYQMGQGPVWASRPISASDAEMLAYLNVLDAAGLRTLLDVEFFSKYLISPRENKALTSAELAALTAYVNKWKMHPAVWGWYADDEGSAAYPIAARQQVYDTIKAAHPAGQVVETHYALTEGAYSPDVHDVYALDAGPVGGGYVYYYDNYGAPQYGCISKDTGLVTNPQNETFALDNFKHNLDGLKVALDAAGETQYFVCMQAFKQTVAGAGQTFAFPPPGALTKMYAKVCAAGLNDYGVGFFLWKSNDASSEPGESLDGVGEAAYSAQRAELATIAQAPLAPFHPPAGPRPVVPTLATYEVKVAGNDVTELVDMDTLHRSMSERGEASATIDIPVASANEVPVNGLARDVEVEIVVDGGREWLGHVVAVHKPKPQDLAYVLDCAGGWDTLHHCAPWCKGFVETRYDAVTELPPSLGSPWVPCTAIDASTDGEVLLTLPKGTTLKSPQAKCIYLWVLGGLATGFSIERITCDVATSGSGVLYWDLWAVGPDPFSRVNLEFVGGGLTNAYSAFIDTGAISADGPLTVLQFQLSALADVAEQESDQTFQVRNIRLYIDRTTAPRVDEIVAAIDADVRPDAPAPSIEAIGSPLTAFMCDPFMTPAEGIAVALTKAAVPPLCGVIQNQLVIKPRPTTPPLVARLWTVSEQITPGLEWGVEVDEEQSVDYVGVAYSSLGPNLIPAMTSATAPSGVASSSGNLNSDYAEWMAFDRTNPAGGATGTWITAAGTTGRVQYQFPTPQIITRYAVTTRNDTAAPDNINAPKTWTFEGSNDGSSWAALDTRTNVTDWAATPNVRKVFDFVNTTAYLYCRMDIAASNGASYVGVGELEMMGSNVPDGAPQIAYYPAAPPDAAARTGLIDGGDLTAAEAMFYAQQGYYFLHKLASGPVTIPYVVRDANGNERPADVIRAWDWVQNVGILDAERAGPFLVSEVEHQGHIATLTIGAAEAYAYNGPDRLPTKGRYVGAHRVRTRTTQRVSFAKYWAWKHRKDKRKPKMPRRHARYGTIRGWKWIEHEGRYV